MKREIKFRAWDNKNKKFPFVGFHLFGEVTMFDLLKQYTLQESIDNLEFSQFTGLTDKNGKEIYEGDIIKYQCFANWDDNSGNLKRHVGVVKFIDNHLRYPSCYCIEMAIEGSNYGYHYLSKYEPLYKTCATWGLEIIGNIYENPELL